MAFLRLTIGLHRLQVREAKNIRKIILAAFLSIGAPADRAAAMPVVSPAALGVTAADASPLEQVRWVRYHHRYWGWRHYHHWGWRHYHYWGWRQYYWGPYYYYLRPYWHLWWGWRHRWYW
jgi:hypothetical protein